MAGFLGGVAGGAGISIVIRAIDNYSKEFKKLDKSVKKQQSSFKKLTSFLKSSGIGYTVLATAAAGFAISAVKGAIKAEVAIQQFELAVGKAAETMLTDMRKASKGMVSDFELITNANKAMALGISKNQIPALLEVATARAKVFGRTTSEAFNDLAIGIGRQSRLILDNLGIILDLDKVYQDFVNQGLAETVEAMTELEKKTALVNAILAESEGLVKANIFLQETHAEKLQRLSASYGNVKDEIGLFTLALFDSISGIKFAEEELARHIDSLTGLEGTYEEAAESTIKLTNAERDLTAELKVSNDEAKNLIDSLLNLSDITFKGERSGNLAIAEQKELIRVLELKNRGVDATEADVQALEDAKWNLDQLRLEQGRFANERDIQSAQNAVDLENIGELTATGVSEFIIGEQQKIDKLAEERAKQEDIRIKILNVQTATKDLVGVFTNGQTEKEKGYDAENESIEELITNTNLLTESYKRAIEARGGLTDFKPVSEKSRWEMVKDLGKEIIRPFTRSSGNSTSVGDAIIRPNGDVIETDPRDTLIATQNPGALGGGGGITLIIEGNVFGVDPENIADALQDKLRDGTTL